VVAGVACEMAYIEARILGAAFPFDGLGAAAKRTTRLASTATDMRPRGP
jgi:hypothetical protein